MLIAGGDCFIIESLNIVRTTLFFLTRENNEGFDYIQIASLLDDPMIVILVARCSLYTNDQCNLNVLVYT